MVIYYFFFFFFFQAEDGIRDLIVTGVQTCALPICPTAPTAIRTRQGPRPNTPCSPSPSGRPSRRSSSRWPCAGSAAAGSARPSSPPIWCAPSSTCPPTGNRWAPSQSGTRPSTPARVSRHRSRACWCAGEDARMTLRQSVLDELTSWQPPNPAQDTLRHSVLAFVLAREDACKRECAPGHVTASALVLDHTGTHALLTLHPRFGRWLQLGGHCEDEDPDVT